MTIRNALIGAMWCNDYLKIPHMSYYDLGIISLIGNKFTHSFKLIYPRRSLVFTISTHDLSPFFFLSVTWTLDYANSTMPRINR